MADAVLYKEAGAVVEDYTPAAATTAGDIIQLADGRAAVACTDLDASEAGSVYTAGQFTVTKYNAVVGLDGQAYFWDKTNSRASYTGDFQIGTLADDAAVTATTCIVNLNAQVRPIIALNKSDWTKQTSTGTVTINPGNAVALDLTTASSAQYAKIIARNGVDIDEKPILETWIDVSDNGDATAMTLDVGFVSSAVASSAIGSEANLITLHLDGNSLDIDIQSDDGTTDTAAFDTGKNAVEDTLAFWQIDCRNKSTPAAYVNGALCSATGITLSAVTGTLYPMAFVGKTANDTPGGLIVTDMIVRTGVRA